MARIRKIDRAKAGGQVHPTETDAEWRIIHTPTGKLLQLSTFGSDARASQPKVSQTIQLDRAAAAALFEAFLEAFPDLGRQQEPGAKT